MTKRFDYNQIFNQAIARIKGVRDPRATRADLLDLNWKEVEKEVVFDFQGGNLRKYNNVADQAYDISVSCIHFLILTLMKHYGYQVEDFEGEMEKKSNILFAIINRDSEELLIFKSIEKSPFYEKVNDESESIKQMMAAYGFKERKYIYFLFDHATDQIIGYQNSVVNKERNDNVYSFKDFFKLYFGAEEYVVFENALKKYIEDANDYIGYSAIKTLSDYSLITFRKVLENELLRFPYEEIIDILVNNYQLQNIEFEKLKDQFINKKTFLAMLGTSDFSESLVTAEWLYDSMKKAKAIDLSIIGMGYFKSIEQLLYEIIRLSECDEITDAATIGTMAVIIKNNINNANLIRSDLALRAKQYIREVVFDYARLRNGYLHKHNIHEWERIDAIRKATFNIIFLLLGGCNVSGKKLELLGCPDEEYTDYYRLCEYINFHAGEIFFLDFGEGKEIMMTGGFDAKSRIEKRRTVYSGVYFQDISEESGLWYFDEDNLPKVIYLGKMVHLFDGSDEVNPIKWSYAKVKCVYLDGKFVGPPIASEDDLDY